MNEAPARVLVLGADGMLGTAWLRLLAARGVSHAALVYPELDITVAAHLDALALDNDTLVVNCSGWTDVDGAEAHEAEATAVNGSGVGELAARCAARGATLVHYSTDYVFDGDASTPYAVDEIQRPLSAYGRSKAAGERALWAHGPRSLLVRTSWLYAPWGKNFVRTIAKLARERDELKVVHDQRGRPTSAEHLAATTWALLSRGTTGIVHVTDGDACSWYELAAAIAQAVRPACVVRPCTTAEFPRPARRPPYSVLALDRAESLLSEMPSWQHNLADVLARLEPE
ncbi:MAG: dTDP-4-dehydrorhamnose reductase [Deltaproteobacteria bacterium]|nr:dTDP-4-dehydrorhamnose reductase [Nannocystaceae bacterium]